MNTDNEQQREAIHSNAKRHWNWTGAKLSTICKTCGKLFEAYSHKGNPKIFCSAQCYHLSKIKVRIPNSICADCGVSYWVQKKDENRTRFCSYKCKTNHGGREKVPARSRFESKVTKTDTCWIWNGKKNNKGYGLIYAGRNNVLAHRFSYEMKFGKIPKGKFGCHKCDNPICVNPDHIFIGTQHDNMRDASLKGRLNGRNKRVSI